MDTVDLWLYIEILNRSSSDQPISLSFIGHQKRQPYSSDGFDVCQASGSDGKTGKPAGDVGFIHSVISEDSKTNLGGKYFGFENDVRLKLL